MLATAGIVNIDPSRYNQRTWACNTKFCFGGWAINLFAGEDHAWNEYGDLLVRPDSKFLEHVSPGGTYYRQADGKILGRWEREFYPEFEETDDVFVTADTGRIAQLILDLEEEDADALFNEENSLEDVNRIALAIVEDKEYEHAEYCSCRKCEDLREPEPCDCASCYEYEDDDDEYDSDAAYEDRNPL